MGKSRFIELMAKKVDGSASESELGELELFLKQYPGHQKIQQVTDALTGTLKNDGADLPQTAINSKLDELWIKIKNSENIETENLVDNVRSFNWQWIGAAAAVVLLTLFGLLFYNKQAKPQLAAILIKKVDVPFGKIMQVTLPDGSQVKLNAGSHFTYPSVFSANKREVNLEGEGFFEVTKNPVKPFLVHTAGFTVKVLGTVFNVKAYRNDKSTETTLLKGKVQVELADDPEKKIILSPLEKLTINKPVQATTNVPVKAAVAKIKYEVATLPSIDSDTYPENAWIKHKIMFANSDFEDVARQMERKYDVHIVFTDESLKKEQISGVLENESLDTALNFLKQIVALQTKTDGNTVYLAYKTKK